MQNLYTQIGPETERDLSESGSDFLNQIQFIDESVIASINSLYVRNTIIALEIENQPYQFSLLPIAPAASDGTPKSAFLADISTKNCKFQIALQDITFMEFLRIPGHNHPPSDVMCAIFEFHFDALLTTIESHSGSPIKIDAIQIEPNVPSKCDYELFFQLVQTSTGIKTIGSFLLDRVSLAWLAQAFRDALAPITIPGYWDLPVRVELLYGKVDNARSLPLGEIKRLGIGDIILDPLDPVVTDDPPSSLLTAKVQGRPMWLIRATIDSLTVVGRVETKMDDKKMGIELTQQNKTDLESLEIDLEFKAGSLKMPLAELKSVQEGYVFDLKPNLHTTYITIHANGRPIARGVFVNMGKRLGVRVIELLFTKD